MTIHLLFKVGVTTASLQHERRVIFRLTPVRYWPGQTF